MLEYMRHAGSVGRVCLEADAEDIILILSRYVEVVGASLVVLEEQGGELELGDMLCALKCEAVELGAGLR